MAHTLSCNRFPRRGLLKMLASSAILGLAGTKGTTWAAGDTQGSAKVWRLAVVPQLTPVEMSRNWTPVVHALAAVGVNCELVVYPSIAQFESEFHQGRADIVFLNPYHMVMAKREKKYLPLLRDSRPLEGVLVVKNDGPVKTLEQLKDHRLAFPAPNAFAASLYIRSVLERQYHLQFEASYAATHRNAIRQVLVGDAAAAGVVKTTLEREPMEIQKDLRVIYTTPPLSPHPIAVHPRVPLAVRTKIIDTLVALAKDPSTKNLMAAIQMPNPVQATYDQDYAPLEKLKIEKFVVIE